MIHQSRYTNDDGANIPMDSYCRNSSRRPMELLPMDERFISYDVANDKLQLDVDHAVLVGLIFNETIINVIKNAFNPSGGRVSVELRRRADMVLLNKSLTQQLKRTLRLRRHQGLNISIEFPA